MNQSIRGPIRVDGTDDRYYTSAFIEQFAWFRDPVGTDGILCVRIDGKDYFHMGVPEAKFVRMHELSLKEVVDARKNGDMGGFDYESAGSFFSSTIKQVHQQAERIDNQTLLDKLGLSDKGVSRHEELTE